MSPPGCVPRLAYCFVLTNYTKLGSAPRRANEGIARRPFDYTEKSNGLAATFGYYSALLSKEDWARVGDECA